MSQQTKVYRYNPRQARQLADALTRCGYQFKDLAHAKFQARGEGMTVSLYNSGKLVVQGRQPEMWATRFLGNAEEVVKKKKAENGNASANGAGNGLAPSQDQSAIGSDEAGKGDSFGGLVVSAVALNESDLLAIAKAKVGDSKEITDDRIRVLAPWIRENFPYAEVVLSPEQYNRRWHDCGDNVNKLLTLMHSKVQTELYGKTDIRVSIVDRFSSAHPVTHKLKNELPGVKVVEVPKAESFPSVAAASILARDSFLTMTKELSDEWAVPIPLGSGGPIPRALRQFLRIHGPDKLAMVAKTHFKNVQRIAEEQRWS